MKFLMMLFFSSQLSAAVIEDCGVFRLRGVVSLDEKTKEVQFSIFNSTKSEMKFKVENKEDTSKILGLKDSGIELIATIPRRLDGMKGEIKDISNVRSVMLDPLKSDEDLELIKTEKCIL